MLPTLRFNLSLSIVQVQAMLKNIYHVDVNYAKAWKRNNKALKHVFESWEQSYAELWMCFNALVSSNPCIIVGFDSE